MPFKSQGLSQGLRDQLDAFIKSNDMQTLYKSYAWENDTYQKGFPDITRLELQLRKSEISTGITLKDAIDVAKWGAMRNQKRISGNAVVLPNNTLISADGDIQSCVESHPQAPIDTLKLINGFGPTYQSKVLRFALPEEYGAIDTRIVRVFGHGDHKAHKHSWLELKTILGTHKGKATGWSIYANRKKWPSGYSRWINILRYIARRIEDKCPHPKQLEERGLRKNEMALFCYASKYT